MSTAQKQEGPARTAILPSRGSNNPSQDIKNMDSNTTSRSKSASDELWSRAWACLNDMETKLLLVENMNQLLFMATERINDQKQMNAIAAQCGPLAALLREVMDIREKVASMIHGRASA